MSLSLNKPYLSILLSFILSFLLHNNIVVAAPKYSTNIGQISTKNQKNFNQPKIALVDIERIISISEAARKADEFIYKLQAEYKENLNQKAKKIKQSSLDYEKIKDSLSKKERMFREQKLQNSLRLLQEELDVRLKDLDVKWSKILDQIGLKIEYIVGRIAKVENYSLVLNKSAIVFHSAKYQHDITDDVIEKLNKNFPEVDYNVIQKKK